MNTRTSSFWRLLPAGLLWFGLGVSAAAQPAAATTRAAALPTDSLAHYIDLASRQNPALNAAWATYQATLQKIPQAFALPDPELEIGWFVKPMEILGGKQLANFTLMQMFPWFGSRQAARAESEMMARMAYEQFRDGRNQLAYEVKSQWYRLCNLHDQLRTTQADLVLLDQLEQLAVSRFASGGISSGAGSNNAAAPAPPTGSMPPAVGASGGMSDMGGMGGGTAPSGTGAGTNGAGGTTLPAGSNPAAGAPGDAMGGMGNGTMGNQNAGSLADVVRIQMEKAETEDKLAALRSALEVASARFNVLLGRPNGQPVCLPDSLEQRIMLPGEISLSERIERQNPMLTMLEAEGNAYQAKVRMDKRMGYPMLGIGLQYSLIGKSDETGMARMADMNGKDMFMPMFKISLPIYRRKYNAQQRESRFRHQASRLKQANTRNQLLADYTDLSNRLEDAQRQVTLYTEQTRRAATAYRLMVNAFAAGISSLTDVIGVERQWLDYRLKKSEAVATYNTVVAGIERLIGENTGEK